MPVAGFGEIGKFDTLEFAWRVSTSSCLISRLVGDLPRHAVAMLDFSTLRSCIFRKLSNENDLPLYKYSSILFIIFFVFFGLASADGLFQTIDSNTVFLISECNRSLVADVNELYRFAITVGTIGFAMGGFFTKFSTASCREIFLAILKDDTCLGTDEF